MNASVKKKKTTGSTFSDIELFVRACDEAVAPNESKSIAEVAKKLGISPTGLISCFKRLEFTYGRPLIESHEAVAGFSVTAAGKIVLRRSRGIFDLFNKSKAEVSEEARIGKVADTVRVSISPYLLAHAFPNAVSTLRKDSDSGVAKVECSEGYYTDKIINSILSNEVDLAVLWGYPEKIQKARLARGICCVLASTQIEPVLVFGKGHRKFEEWAKSGVRPRAFLDELAGETLFHLEQDHQPLYDEIPPPDLASGGRRESYTTIMSIIGSIRAGMNGVAVLPAIYRDIDKYRRDGNLYFIPIERRNPDGSTTKIKIKIIYLFRGTKSQQRGLEHIPVFDKGLLRSDDSVYKLLTESTKDVLNYIDSSVLAGLSDRSAWDDAVEPGVSLTADDVRDFGHSFHISPAVVGLSEPVWKHSEIGFDRPIELPSSGRCSAFTRTIYPGRMTLSDPGERSIREYSIEGELVDQMVFSIKGRLVECRKDGVVFPAKPDSFVATLGFQTPDKDLLYGVVSAQDDCMSSPLVGTFALVKKRYFDEFDEKEVAFILWRMKNRTHIRTDVRIAQAGKDYSI